jgi:hypothetical protein
VDILENGAYDDGSAPEGEVVDQDDTWRHPTTLGLTALALAVLSLIGARAVSGTTYTLLIAHESTDPTQNKNLLVGGAFLTAVFALLPVVLAKLGLDRLVPDDGPWAGHVLRAGLVLGGIAFALHLVHALLALAADDSVGLQFLF